MYAIIEESGGQRKVMQDEEILVDLLEGGEARAGAKVTFHKVLVVGEVGGTAKFGAPYVEGATVTGEIVEPMVQGEKLYIFKFRPKKGHTRKTGHRQRYTSVKITSING